MRDKRTPKDVCGEASPCYTSRHGSLLNSGYIDDSYLPGDTVEDCQQYVGDSVTLFTRLGFFIHPEKSVCSYPAVDILRVYSGFD